jgi:hypothetical protein
LAAGHTLADAACAAKLAVRIICDFGLVCGGNGKPDKKPIARLQAADDFPGLPLGSVLATEAFAAQAKFDLGDKIVLVPVGRVEALPASEAGERQAIRARPSLPIYTAARAARGQAAQLGLSVAKI